MKLRHLPFLMIPAIALFSFSLLSSGIKGMGDVDGFEICRRIRLADISIGIIMLTSLHEFSCKTLGYDSGTDDYIVKPFDFRELLLKIGTRFISS